MSHRTGRTFRMKVDCAIPLRGSVKGNDSNHGGGGEWWHLLQQRTGIARRFRVSQGKPCLQFDLGSETIVYICSCPNMLPRMRTYLFWHTVGLGQVVGNRG